MSGVRSTTLKGWGAYGLRSWGNSSQQSMLRDQLRRKNKLGDALWRMQRRKQAAKEKKLARERAAGFKKYAAALARRAELKRKQTVRAELRTRTMERLLTKRAEIKRVRHAKMELQMKQKQRELLAAKTRIAVRKRADRLKRSLIAARKSAAYHRKRQKTTER